MEKARGNPSFLRRFLKAPIYEGKIISPGFNVSGYMYNRTINKEGDPMDNEYIQELFDQAASGEISYLELQDYLDDARFDGDIIDFL